MRPIQPIDIVLDRPRHLLLNLKALALAERELATLLDRKKVSLIKVFQSGEVGVSDLVCLVWAGLLHEDPTLTLDQAMALLGASDLESIATKLMEAMQAHMGVTRTEEAPSLPDPTQATAPAATTPPLPASTGSNSGASGAFISG